jgi:hypothetical protein
MASNIDLCTLADVRKYSPNVQGEVLNELIETLIATESAHIENVCDRPLRDRGVDIVQTFDGEGGQRLPLPSYPITSISSVVVDGIAWPHASSSMSFGYVFDGRFVIATTNRWPRGVQNITVTYRAGYDLETLPYNLRQACVELVDLRLQERKRQGVQSKTVGGEQVSYADKEMPNSIRARLRGFEAVITASRVV